MSSELYLSPGLPDITIAKKLFEKVVTNWDVELSWNGIVTSLLSTLADGNSLCKIVPNIGAVS